MELRIIRSLFGLIILIPLYCFEFRKGLSPLTMKSAEGERAQERNLSLLIKAIISAILLRGVLRSTGITVKRRFDTTHSGTVLCAAFFMMGICFDRERDRLSLKN